MKLHNRTRYLTADLRVIIRRVAADELADHPVRRARLTVGIAYGRGVGVSGVAWRNSHRVLLRVPKTNLNPVLFAWLAAHEVAHVRGMGHRQMPAYLNNFTATSRTRWGWAAALPLRQAVPVVPNALAALQAQRDHVLTMLQKADTRLKRATTIRAKWARRLALAERRLAAAYQTEPLHTDGDLPLAPAAGRGDPCQS